MMDENTNLFPAADTDANLHKDFQKKIKTHARAAGKRVIMHGLKLYFSLKGTEVPRWAKGVIVGALGYFIAPIDILPDIIPAVGFTDDLGVLAAAVASVHLHINAEVVAQAQEKFDQIFG